MRRLSSAAAAAAASSARAVAAAGPLAVLHQAQPPPAVNGVIKPMKPGGYRDSGADIAHALASAAVPGLRMVTPHAQPDPSNDTHWVL